MSIVSPVLVRLGLLLSGGRFVVYGADLTACRRQFLGIGLLAPHTNYKTLAQRNLICTSMLKHIYLIVGCSSQFALLVWSVVFFVLSLYLPFCRCRSRLECIFLCIFFVLLFYLQLTLSLFLSHLFFIFSTLFCVSVSIISWGGGNPKAISVKKFLNIHINAVLYQNTQITKNILKSRRKYGPTDKTRLFLQKP